MGPAEAPAEEEPPIMHPVLEPSGAWIGIEYWLYREHRVYQTP